MIIKKTLFFVLLTVTITFGAISNTFAIDGEMLFAKKCKACHKTPGEPAIKKKYIGPNLEGLKNRPGWTKEWEDKWLSDPKSVWAIGGGYVETLKKSLGAENRKKTKMLVSVKKAVDRTALIEYLMKF